MSHTDHHLYTLHPEGDREVLLPRNFPINPLKVFQLFTIDVVLFFTVLKEKLLIAISGKFNDEWSNAIFTADQIKVRKQVVNWDRFHLIFHLCVIIGSILLKLWMLPVLVTLGRFIANWWIFLIGATMHAGLRDNINDFRLNTRTIKLDPFSQYLRWHMNYHIEPHMFAAVPCYNLAKLYRVVKSDMPERRSLLQAWREMRATEKKQKSAPTYQFDTPLPDHSNGSAIRSPLGAEIGDIKPNRFAD